MIWCLGVYASGSTWVFNAVIKVATAVVPSRPVAARFVTCRQELDFLDDPVCLPVVKSHDTDEAAAIELARRADVVLLSIRDPRDCVTSLMLYQRYRFPAALEAVERTARYCARFSADPRVIVLRYEDRFIDDPATLDRIALICGGRLADADRMRIFAETRRPAIEAHIAMLSRSETAIRDPASGDLVDLATQWHTHHAGRSGEIGRWRHLLTLAEVAATEHRLQAWMADFGYPPEVAPLTQAVGAGTRGGAP
jgi:hypothetical protein